MQHRPPPAAPAPSVPHGEDDCPLFCDDIIRHLREFMAYLHVFRHIGLRPVKIAPLYVRDDLRVGILLEIDVREEEGQFRTLKHFESSVESRQGGQWVLIHRHSFDERKRPVLTASPAQLEAARALFYQRFTPAARALTLLVEQGQHMPQAALPAPRRRGPILAHDGGQGDLAGDPPRSRELPAMSAAGRVPPDMEAKLDLLEHECRTQLHDAEERVLRCWRLAADTPLTRDIERERAAAEDRAALVELDREAALETAKEWVRGGAEGWANYYARIKSQHTAKADLENQPAQYFEWMVFFAARLSMVARVRTFLEDSQSLPVAPGPVFHEDEWAI